MVTLKCISRTGKKSSRFNLNVESLSLTVSELRNNVSTHVKLNPFEIELIYAGRSLKDDQKMEDYGLKPGCTLHVFLKKYSEHPSDPDPIMPEGISQVNVILKLAEGSSKYRQSIEKVLTNSEVIDNIIEATPGLASDHIAIALLKDHILLQQVAREEDVIKKLLKEHPSLGLAVQHLVTVINEEVAKVNSSSTAGATSAEEASSSGLMSSYSIDSLSEEDDDQQLAGPSWGSVHQNRPITADQLASALAMATGMTPSSAAHLFGTPPSSPSTSSLAAAGASSSSAPPPPMPPPTFPPPSSSQSRLISPTFFQQAMQAALGTSDSSESTQSQPPFADVLFDPEDTIFGPLLGAGVQSSAPSVVSDSAVEQLRQMGITDEEVARRALEASAGDIRAALDLIFGDGMMF